MIDFDGRSVVVTGAAGGVGSALVTVLSACGGGLSPATWKERT
jgi:NAD(P)-dependent dehydrogenase (short-subunit alcohol dehydrogenase family)